MAKKTKDPQIARLEARAKKANEELRYAKACDKYGFYVTRTARQLNDEARKLARALPKETRQRVLDMWRAGGKSINDMATECGVSPQECCGVILINTKTIKYKVLNTETV